MLPDRSQERKHSMKNLLIVNWTELRVLVWVFYDKNGSFCFSNVCSGFLGKFQRRDE